MASEEIFRRLKEQADWTLLLFPRAALLLTVWRLLRFSRDSRPLSQAALVHQAEPERALTLLRGAATQGHFRAQMELGLMLLHGHGCANGDAQPLEAAAWLEKSAQQGYFMAMVRLAEVRGRHGDPRGALKWLERAAEQRADPAVMHQLGLALITGTLPLGEGKDGTHASVQLACEQGRDLPTMGRRWLAEAAEMGHPAAQYEVGRLALESMASARASAGFTSAGSASAAPGVRTHSVEVEAEIWLERSAANGHAAAASALARRYASTGQARKLMILLISCWRRWRHVSSKTRVALPVICFHEGTYQ